MEALKELRHILKSLAQKVEVLPAVGGAVEDLEQPDFEEREDQALNEKEKVFKTIFEECDPRGGRPPLYRPVPPVGRAQNHLFRYFLDGSLRSYFLGTVLENDRGSPVHFAQIGACVLRREDDGSVQPEQLRVDNILLAGKKRLSQGTQGTWQYLEGLCRQRGIRLIDLTEKGQDILSRGSSDSDLRNKAGGKVRFAMRTLEKELMEGILPQLSDQRWLIADGSLLFDPILTLLSGDKKIPPVIGVSKNFRKDPQFVYGRGPRAERRSIYKLLADLKAEHRTAAFSARGGKVVFWYVRLREQGHLDYPLMGVVKVELVNPTQKEVPSNLIDRISQALVAERTVTPHGQDRRWHAHLYPIFLAERAVKESFFSREAVQQYLKWR